MSKISFRVRRGLEVPAQDLPEGLATALKEAFTHSNSDYQKRKHLGFYVGNLPRTIDNYDVEEDEWGNDWLVLPRGATEKVRRTLAARGHVPEYLDERFESEEVDFPILPRGNPVELWPHQERIVEVALARENSLIRSATGSGKSEAALEFIRQARQQAVIIVWTSGLLQQWIDRIQSRWGWSYKDIGRWQGSTRRIGRVTVAMQQSLNRPEAIRFFASIFGTVVCDEVSRFAARTLLDTISKFPARYRLGLSADERRKDRKDFLIREHFGKVAEDISKDELVALGHLCEVEIVVVPTNFHYPPVEDAPPEDRTEKLAQHYTTILNTMETDVDRNSIATRIAAFEVRRRASSVIVFCERVDQARTLCREIAIVEAIPCGLMLGQKKNLEAFKEAKERLTSGELRCAVAGKAAYRGEDIPRLSTGIVVTPTGNNKQLIEQQAGRLRRKFGTKVMGRLYYLWDVGLFPDTVDNLKRWYRGLVKVKTLDEVLRG